METLFHYTNIEKLALILKTGRIRLNSLDKMDDLEENMTDDIYNAGMFTYVSCWTADEKESIALWKQYTDYGAGVRIELPKNPFKKYIVLDLVKDERFRKVFSVASDTRTIIRLDQMLESNYFTQVITGDDILVRVAYSEKEDEINPRIISYDILSDMTRVALSKIGKCKREAWSFQKEWRYIVQFYPGNILTVYEDDRAALRNVFIEICDGNVQQPFPYYDLEIDEQAFRKMRIVLSPTITEGNEILIRSVVEKYNPDAEIFRSAFQGKIR